MDKDKQPEWCRILTEELRKRLNQRGNKVSRDNAIQSLPNSQTHVNKLL